MPKFKLFFGGVRMGMARATVPLATLYVKQNKIIINVLLFRMYNLSEDKVVSIQETNSGVEIKTLFPKRIVFWCINPKSIINSINQIGFEPKADENLVKSINGFPARISSIILLFLCWFISYFLDKYLPHIEIINLGFFNSYGVLFNFLIFIILIILFRLRGLHRIILKSDHDFEEIRPEFFMLILVFGIFWALVLLYYLKEFLSI
ncbi:MAG: hypothetical protein ACFFDN_42620 [Candidatus Hodarchaeota archaeon]